MAANMSMMLMKQMEAINKSMYNMPIEKGKTRGGRGSIAKNVLQRKGKRRGQRRQPSKGWWIMEVRPGEGAVAIVVAAAATAVTATAVKATVTAALEMQRLTLFSCGHFYI